MTWRDGFIFLMAWLAVALIIGPFIGKAIKKMRDGDQSWKKAS